jgi:hypothetical protein
MDSKLEIKIIKDSKKDDAELHAMSLEVAKAFLTIVDSVTKIIEQIPDNENLKINIKSGSVTLLVEGDGIDILQKDFLDVIEKGSTDKLMVEPWRNIQNLFRNNGLQYEATISTDKVQTSIFEILKKSKTLRTKPSKRQVAKTNIQFIEGKLIEIGGKSPNIHVELSSNKKITIGCTESNAFKARNYLYQTIFLSSWVQIKNGVKEYELCDSYKVGQDSVYYKLNKFIEEFENAEDEIESLSILHDECRNYLDGKDYGNFRKFLRLFIHHSTDVNTLHTILILGQFFRDNSRLKDQINDMEILFNAKVKNLNKKNKVTSARNY